MGSAQVNLEVVRTSGDVADDLGSVRAAIAELREREKAYVAEFLGFDVDASEGALFRGKRVAATTREKTNWEKIARDLGASPQRIRANTTTVLIKAGVRTYGRKQG